MVKLAVGLLQMVPNNILKVKKFVWYKKYVGGPAADALTHCRWGFRGCLEIVMCDCDVIFSSLQNITRGDDQQGFNGFCRRGSDLVQHKGHVSQLCRQWGTWKSCGNTIECSRATETWV